MNVEILSKHAVKISCHPPCEEYKEGETEPTTRNTPTIEMRREWYEKWTAGATFATIATKYKKSISHVAYNVYKFGFYKKESEVEMLRKLLAAATKRAETAEAKIAELQQLLCNKGD